MDFTAVDQSNEEGRRDGDPRDLHRRKTNRAKRLVLRRGRTPTSSRWRVNPATEWTPALPALPRKDRQPPLQTNTRPPIASRRRRASCKARAGDAPAATPRWKSANSARLARSSRSKEESTTQRAPARRKAPPRCSTPSSPGRNGPRAAPHEASTTSGGADSAATSSDPNSPSPSGSNSASAAGRSRRASNACQRRARPQAGRRARAWLPPEANPAPARAARPR